MGSHGVPPRRIAPRALLVGRDPQVAIVRAAFQDAQSGGCRALLISGPPGIGKTALAEVLRPVVDAANGWFLTAAFDEHRRDRDGAMYGAIRDLARRVLAEPEDELARLRRHISAALGPNAGLLCAIVPEFAAVVDAAPSAGDVLTVHARLERTAADLLRAIASPGRPVVLLLDNLHGAGRLPLRVADALLSERIDGLLLIGAYQDRSEEPAGPLAATLADWQGRAGVRHLPLEPLTVPDAVTLLAQSLRMDPIAAAQLVEVLDQHARGNPALLIELVNGLLRDNLLRPTAEGWRWETPLVRAHLGRSDVSSVLVAGVEALPGPTRHVVEALTCLGGRAELTLLEAATGKSPTALDLALAPAVEEGLVVVEPGDRPAVMFRDARLREVVLRGLDRPRQDALRLAMARRLAPHDEFEGAAAEQFLPVVGTLDDPAERRQVAGVLRRVARRANAMGGYAAVEALLNGAVQLIDPADTTGLIETRSARHAALYSMGALDQADLDYAAIVELPATAAARAAASAVQVRSLTQRNQLAAAIELGLSSLRELGVVVPPAERIGQETERLFGAFDGWLEGSDAVEPTRGEAAPPTVLAAADLINAAVPAALFAEDRVTHGWLSLQAWQIWIEHGPGSGLSGAACNVGLAAVALRGDYRAAYRAVLRILARSVGDPSEALVRFHVAVLSCWFEPVEETVAAARLARDELIALGDVANAGYCYHLAVACLVDSAPTLDACRQEVEEGLVFLRRVGSAQSVQWLDGYRWLADTLAGRSAASSDEPLVFDTYADNPAALLHWHLNHALAAAILGPADELARHSAAATELLIQAPGFYTTALVRVLRGLTVADHVRTAGGEQSAPLAELADITGWLADRAVDAPDNFLHLLHLLEAERAWALGDFRAAVVAFDAARREVDQLRRPWHRALILERAARFSLEHGLGAGAADLLAQARQAYAGWGATAKVDQLDWAYPVLHGDPRAAAEPDAEASGPDLEPASGGSTSSVDLLGILAASRALSSQTSVHRLRARVAQVLRSMTGATDVDVLLWDDERQDWQVSAADEDGGTAAPDLADQEGTVPSSVLRYVRRTGETLVVVDAMRDERFRRDPYFAGLDCCSVLAVPVAGGGRPRALLVLKNRLISGAFTAERLDAVRLIAGQLAVSLDNAQLYAASRRMTEEQATLRRVATLVARGVTPRLVFTSVAQEVGQLFRAQLSGIVRFEPDGDVTVMGAYGVAMSGLGTQDDAAADALAAAVRGSGRPARWDAEDPARTTPSGPRPRGVRSMAASPILVEGRVWGCMTVGSQGDLLPADAEHRLAEFTELVATAIANADSRAELAASRARVVAAADETRRRIERDLHDGTQQRLISVALQVRAAQAEVPAELTELSAGLDRAVAEASAALDELRETARGIHPAILTEGGLVAALRTLARRSPIPVDLDLQAPQRLPAPVEVSAYYIAAEALTNAAKHAAASGVTVTLRVQRRDADDVAILSIVDDGAGGADFDRGTGLLGLRDRVEALGGRISLESSSGAGTALTVELPIREGPDAPGLRP